MGVCFLIRDASLAFPRSVLLVSGFLYFVLLSLEKTFVWNIGRKSHGIKKIAVISSKNDKLADEIESRYSNFYKIEHKGNETDVLTPEDINSVDEVFLSTDVSNSVRKRVLALCINTNKDIFFVPTFFDLSIMSSTFFKTGDIPTYRISNVPISSDKKIIKRAMDLVLSSIALVVFSPIILILIALIKFDGGPAFYIQERLTEGGKIFKMIKFRTMIPDAEKVSGPVLAGQNDPRITKIGNFMRTVRLDEVPQLINILRGEMSIVGPRPERPFFTEQFQKEMPEYSYRLKVKAGLTGLAQVEGKYNTSAEDKLRYDLIYINNFSLWNDIVIILQTIKILFMKSSTEGVSN
jgi:exopolysaccharide biosynthesis polyprenyl glycosylphosphotransferase